MKRPLLLEGPAGVGKTDLARAAAEALGRPMIRLQCYEGLDEARATSARVGLRRAGRLHQLSTWNVVASWIKAEHADAPALIVKNGASCSEALS